MVDHLVVGDPAHHRAGRGRRSARQLAPLDPAGRHASHVALPVRLTAAPHLDLELRGERVHHRRAHPVQPARDLVPAAAELAPGVQHGQHRLQRRLARLGVLVGRNPPTVVANLNPAPRLQRHIDPRCMPRHRLIDRVVDNLVHQMMQPRLTGRADVHPRPPPDRLNAFQNVNVRGVVTALLILAPPRRGSCRGATEGVLSTDVDRRRLGDLAVERQLRLRGFLLGQGAIPHKSEPRRVGSGDRGPGRYSGLCSVYHWHNVRTPPREMRNDQLARALTPG